MGALYKRLETGRQEGEGEPCKVYTVGTTVGARMDFLCNKLAFQFRFRNFLHRHVNFLDVRFFLTTLVTGPLIASSYGDQLVSFLYLTHQLDRRISTNDNTLYLEKCTGASYNQTFDSL
jgi:hypothetical protein